MRKFIFIALVFSAQFSLAQPAVDIVVQGDDSNPSLMFLPGFTTPGSVWDATIEQLPGEYRTHVVSYAGFAGMAPIELPWYDSLTEELLAYIDANDLQNLTIIGHSMGGTLALELAVERPEQISGLVLVDSLPNMLAVVMPGVTADQLFLESPYNTRMLAMTDEQMAGMAQMQAQTMAISEEHHAQLAEWIMVADRETYVYGYTELLKLDLRGDLDRIKARALVLGTSFPDVDAIRSNLESQYDLLENKRIVQAETARHFIMLDEPDWFYAQLTEFLRN